MQVINEERLKERNYLLYIHTPFCGTCHIARKMLTQIETAHKNIVFYEMNAAFYPTFMQNEQIESVPCLLIKVDGEIKTKLYTFKTIPNIYYYLFTHMPELFKK